LRRFNSLTEVHSELTAGTTTCRQLVEYYLDNIRQKSHLNAFLEVWPDEALAQADAVDAKLAGGTAGKLAGMVIGLKDVLAYKDHALQSSSHILDGFKSLYTGSAAR
jgi:aspartyl-tRNA(Asn)/glutamyl-tRNA(Gln) amidotransferase subunit A